MTIQTGDRVPNTVLHIATEDGPEQIDTDAFFAGRRVALFSVPGAFTPTCSVRHLPGFVDKAEAFKAKGVDEVACTAVNDAFVMRAWSESVEAGETVTMLADGNAAFAKALGLDTDSSAYGMGVRGRRYSMLVQDGVVEQLHVEEPGQFEVSSADYLLERL